MIMFDSTSVLGSELLSYFGKNTAIRIDHRYGAKECAVISARTGNIIATVEALESGYAVSGLFVAPTLESAASIISGNKKFPRNRKMNRTWSPIRLTAKAEADAEITRNTILWTAQ
jgi:hypothetical protein